MPEDKNKNQVTSTYRCPWDGKLYNTPADYPDNPDEPKIKKLEAPPKAVDKEK